jgi:hypothetical protein
VSATDTSFGNERSGHLMGAERGRESHAPFCEGPDGEIPPAYSPQVSPIFFIDRERLVDCLRGAEPGEVLVADLGTERGIRGAFDPVTRGS